MTFRRLDETMYVAGQIGPEDVVEAARAGIRLIVNNRPDGESPSEPQGDAIAATAATVGIDYVAIPVDHSGFRPDQAEAMRAALDAADGPVLAYCRSGTRSTFLWAMASKLGGADGDGLIAKAGAAGYDLSPIAGMLRR